MYIANFTCQRVRRPLGRVSADVGDSGGARWCRVPMQARRVAASSVGTAADQGSWWAYECAAREVIYLSRFALDNISGYRVLSTEQRSRRSG